MKKIFFCLFLIPCTASAIGGSFSASNNMTSQADSLYVNITGEDDIFEKDSNGYIVPSVSGMVNTEFEIDSHGYIVPKDLECFSQDTSGYIIPMQ